MQKTEPDSRSLSYAVKDGVYYSIMAGIGESYISPFAIFLKATNSQIAFLASIPPLLGALVQLIPAYCLSRMSNPPYKIDDKDDFSLIEFFADFKHSSFVRFVVYTGLMHFSVMVAAPFFSVYMLRDLRFSYLQFMLVSAVAVLVQYFTLHNWGKFGDKFGNRMILVITGFTLPLVPVLWLFSANFYYILLIQMLAGFSWAGFSLSMGNFIFDAIPQPKRAKSVAIFNVLNAVGIFSGAAIGGWLTRYIPVSISIQGFSILMISNLQWLFLISGVLRLFMSISFLPAIREMREVEPLTLRELIFRVSSIRPISGLKFDLFTGNQRGKKGTKDDQ